MATSLVAMLSTLSRAGICTPSIWRQITPVTAHSYRRYSTGPASRQTPPPAPLWVNPFPAPKEPTDWTTLDVTLTKTSQVIEKKKLVTRPKLPEDLWAYHSQQTLAKLFRPPTTYAGRSFEVKEGDLQATINKVSVILRRNKVWQELRRAQRHEKKGYKRRRLASKRWRTYFADQVRQKVRLVQAIRRRGA